MSFFLFIFDFINHNVYSNNDNFMPKLGLFITDFLCYLEIGCLHLDIDFIDTDIDY